METLRYEVLDPTSLLYVCQLAKTKHLEELSSFEWHVSRGSISTCKKTFITRLSISGIIQTGLLKRPSFCICTMAEVLEEPVA